MKKLASITCVVLINAFGLRSAAADTEPELTREYETGVGSGYEVIGLVLVGGSLVNLGFTIKDVATSEHSNFYLVSELVVTAPQALLWGSIAAEEPHPVFIGLTVWNAALSAHAIYKLAQGKPVAKPRKSVSVVPMPVTDGKQMGGGIGVIGRF